LRGQQCEENCRQDRGLDGDFAQRFQTGRGLEFARKPSLAPIAGDRGIRLQIWWSGLDLKTL
jgi:hypothetical protein